MSHTPGPWIVFFADRGGPNDILPAMRPGCIARDVESEADARLIAAAPELYSAVQHALVAFRALGKGKSQVAGLLEAALERVSAPSATHEKDAT